MEDSRRAAATDRAQAIRDIMGHDAAAGRRRRHDPGELKSTSGNLRFEGGLKGGEGQLEVETFSGSVSLVFPRDVQARFELVTFGGKIESALGPKTPTGGKFSPYKKLRFSTGSDDFEVAVQTYDGNIALQLTDAAEAR